MNPIWETTFKVRAFDVDANDQLKVSTILDYFQDAASNDAERLNFGYKDFVPKGLLWVLSWAKFEFIDYPKFADEVKIQSWGKKQYKLYSMRDYLLLDLSGKIICRGTSGWLLLDSKSLRPKILTQLFPEIKMHDSQGALEDLPEKMHAPNKVEKIYTSEIRYSHIDLNQHANNAKYIEMMLDCFKLQFYKKHKIKKLTISFTAESKFGEKIDLYLGDISETPLKKYIEARNTVSGKSVFQSIIEWS